MPEAPQAPADCLIVGAGPAGLTAAIYLARFRRSTALLDSGDSRARLIPVTRNCPGHPKGISGDGLLERLRAQARYHGVRVRHQGVDSLVGRDGAFAADAGGTSLRARKVILATGVKDRRPELERHDEHVRAGLLRYCPVCDAHELIDKDVAIVGSGDGIAAHALFMRTFTARVTVLSTDPRRNAFSDAERAEMGEAGVRLIADPGLVLDFSEGRAAARLRDGAVRHFDSMYAMLGCEPRSHLGHALGARQNGTGELEVDEHQATNVPGLYAIGDITGGLNQLSVAFGQAAIAATAVHNGLAPNWRGGSTQNELTGGRLARS